MGEIIHPLGAETSQGIGMNHRDIEEHQVVDRYLMGRLAPEEAEVFEQHFLGCPECLERLELAEKLQLGFKAAAVQAAVARATVARASVLATLARVLRSPQGAGLLAALLVVAIAPIGWLTSRLEQRDDRLAQLEARFNEKQEEVLAADRERTAALAEQQKLETQLAQALAPQVNPLFVSLGTERGYSVQEPNAQGPSTELHLPAKPCLIVLSLDVDGLGRPSYTARLLGPEDELRWTSDPLVPDDQTLNVAFHSSSLGPGDYTVRVHGGSADGPILASYRFRAVAAPSADVR